MHIKPLKIIKNTVPILKWSKSYNSEKFITDLVAGITVGLTLIPQSIAYAGLAGLGPQYGLYSSICGGFIYAIFGTISELNVAPTSLISLFVLSYTENVTFGRENAAILLCFLAGIIEILCSILRLGFLVDFVSSPVVSGFTSAGAITIASAQVKNLFGIPKLKSGTFANFCYNFILNIKDIALWDTLLGVCCIIFLLCFRKLKDYGTAPFVIKGNDEKRNYLRNFLWFCSISRNAFVVIFTTILAYILTLSDSNPFALTKDVPSGLPNISIPITYYESGNRTYNFIDLVKELNLGIFIIPLVSILANVAVAKSFANGKVIDATQEMLAVGLCNLASSFVSSMPINASFSRAAVSNASGVKTPFSSVYTSIMVILALTFLTPYFYYIPKSTLAAVIICAVYFMIEWTISKNIWKLNKLDVISYFATLLSGLLLGVEIGILIGVLTDILILLYHSSRPKILAENVPIKEGMSYLKLTPSSGITYAAAEYVRNKILKYDIEYGNGYKVIVIDFSRVSSIDYTAGKIMGTLIQDLHKTEKRVIFLRPKPVIAKILMKTCGKQCCVANAEDAIVDLIYGQIANIKPKKNFYYAIETTQM